MTILMITNIDVQIIKPDSSDKWGCWAPPDHVEELLWFQWRDLKRYWMFDSSFHLTALNMDFISESRNIVILCEEHEEMFPERKSVYNSVQTSGDVPEQKIRICLKFF